jgi:hypothetical protein
MPVSVTYQQVPTRNQLAMAHTAKSHKSVMKISPNETLPRNREMIPANWAPGVTFKSAENSGAPQPEGASGLASFASFHEALIEASKFLIIPQIPPYDHQMVEKKYRDALSKKRAAVAHLVEIQAECEDHESNMSDHVGEAAAERFLAKNIGGFGISYDYPVSFNPTIIREGRTLNPCLSSSSFSL